MNTATRKAKGKRLQKYVCNLILKYYSILNDQDVKSIRMGRKEKMFNYRTKQRN